MFAAVTRRLSWASRMDPVATRRGCPCTMSQRRAYTLATRATVQTMLDCSNSTLSLDSLSLFDRLVWYRIVSPRELKESSLVMFQYLLGNTPKTQEIGKKYINYYLLDKLISEHECFIDLKLVDSLGRYSKNHREEHNGKVRSRKQVSNL